MDSISSARSAWVLASEKCAQKDPALMTYRRAESSEGDTPCMPLPQSNLRHSDLMHAITGQFDLRGEGGGYVGGGREV